MPNAGIQGWRSTSWNSGEPALNDAHIASVTPKTATETSSVTQRTRPLRRPSAFPMNNSSAAPATGSSHDMDNNGKFNESPLMAGLTKPALAQWSENAHWQARPQ